MADNIKTKEIHQLLFEVFCHFIVITREEKGAVCYDTLFFSSKQVCMTIIMLLHANGGH